MPARLSALRMNAYAATLPPPTALREAVDLRRIAARASDRRRSVGGMSALLSAVREERNALSRRALPPGVVDGVLPGEDNLGNRHKGVPLLE